MGGGEESLGSIKRSRMRQMLHTFRVTIIFRILVRVLRLVERPAVGGIPRLAENPEVILEKWWLAEQVVVCGAGVVSCKLESYLRQ